MFNNPPAGMNPTHALSRRVGCAMQGEWWARNMPFASPQENDFMAAFVAAEGSGGGWDTLPACHQATILRAEGNPRAAQMVEILARKRAA